MVPIHERVDSLALVLDEGAQCHTIVTAGAQFVNSQRQLIAAEQLVEAALLLCPGLKAAAAAVQLPRLEASQLSEKNKLDFRWNNMVK